jgi:CubicO group peptidase (beta-lactamase class C family)
MSTAMTTAVPTTAQRVREAIVESVSAFTIPGVQVAWLCEGEAEQVAAGSLRLGRPGAVSADTLFPLGSVTKIFTASLALQLVGDGALTLDEPIADTLPPGRSREALGEVSLRQLLTHTGGLENDHASSDDLYGSPREYVRACERERLFPAGEHFSYSNAGYVVIGHLIEAATGQSWAESLRAFVLDPLEVRGGFFLSEALAPGAMADGHVRRPDGEIVSLAAPSTMGRAWAPAAGLALSAMGVLRLVQMHLDGGRTALGFRLLDPDLVTQMRAHSVTVPDPGFASGWGLGWALLQGVPGPEADAGWFGHDGEEEGWTARVRASADRGFAIVMLASCLPADGEWRQLLAALESAGVSVGEPVVPEPSVPAAPIDPSVIGSYENGFSRITVFREDDDLWLTDGVLGRVALRPLDADRCLAMPAGWGEPPFLVAFLRDGDRSVRYLHAGGRIARRMAAQC